MAALAEERASSTRLGEEKAALVVDRDAAARLAVLVKDLEGCGAAIPSPPPPPFLCCLAWHEIRPKRPVWGLLCIVSCVACGCVLVGTG